MSHRFKMLWINLKYSFLKYFGWQDAFHSDLYSENSDTVYSAYVYGKRHEKVRIKKYPKDASPPLGMYPWYVEFEDGCSAHIASQDTVLFLPWSESKEGKKYWKEKEKRWSTRQ